MPRIKGVLAGGLGFGLVAALLGNIPYLDFGCCLWTTIGGMIATIVHIKSTDDYLTKGDGAKTGLITGAVMYVPWLLFYPLARLAKLSAKMGSVEAAIDSMDMLFKEPILLGSLLGTLLVAFVFYLGFSTVGGIIGVHFFETRTPSEFDV